MSKKSTEDKIKNISEISSDIEYLRDELSGKLHAKKGFDGEIDIITFLDFAIEHGYFLEHLLTVSKKFKELTV